MHLFYIKKINCKGRRRADKWYLWHLDFGENMCAFCWLIRMSNLVDFQVVMTEKGKKNTNKKNGIKTCH